LNAIEEKMRNLTPEGRFIYSHQKKEDYTEAIAKNGNSERECDLTSYTGRNNFGKLLTFVLYSIHDYE
jgi:hypothetical protein